jgi:hypothetical protein
MSIRAEYEKHGPSEYYRLHGASYRNPHELAVRSALHAAVREWQPDLTHVLDLACGSGEATLALWEAGAARVDGLDPYTAEAYQERTGQAAETLSFEAVSAGALEGRRYSLIVCSYALHLLEESRLPQLVYQLSRVAPALWVLTPHKRPHLRAGWGWQLSGEQVVERVRARYYTAIDV